jgi:DNA-binding transcriptional regulator GbsR (MarR family)
MKILENIFASKAQAKLLNLFFKDPNQKFYQRELVTKTQESLGSIQYEIKRLGLIGLINSQKEKRKVYYSLNKEFYLYSQIRDIIIKTAQKNL